MQEIEGNKIIAEFMGYRTFAKRFPRNHGIGAHPLSNEPEVKDIIVEKCKYHSDWSWLMPVGKKFFDLEYDGDDYHVHLQHIDNISSGTYEFDIKKTWRALLHAIKWHNQNGKGGFGAGE